MIAIVKKELKYYFMSVIGYILLAGFIFLNAYYFSGICIRYGYPDYSYVISYMVVIYLIMIPILTMRLFAEEAKQKTDQLLYTSPLKIEQIVLGKYLSALAFLLIAVLVMALFPISLTFFGEVPAPQIIGSFVGFLLLGASFISIGMFISVLTDNQIVAAFGSFGIIFLLYSLDGIKSNAPADTTASVVFIIALLLAFSYVLYDATKNIFAGIAAAVIGFIVITILAATNPLVYDGVIYKFLDFFSLISRFNNFSSGILNISDIVYYITFSVMFIYLTINVIEKRRWK